MTGVKATALLLIVDNVTLVLVFILSIFAQFAIIGLMTHYLVSIIVKPQFDHLLMLKLARHSTFHIPYRHEHSA